MDRPLPIPQSSAIYFPEQMQPPGPKWTAPTEMRLESKDLKIPLSETHLNRDGLRMSHALLKNHLTVLYLCVRVSVRDMHAVF